MNRLTWDKFKASCGDVERDFESLCRALFKWHILKDANTPLPQSPNQAGIEVEPIEYEGKHISFQAKYFSGKVSYKNILESAEKTVKYYAGQLDCVYLFCNKDLTVGTQTYKKTIDILKASNIELILICNENILDFSAQYDIIKHGYFSEIIITDDELQERLKCNLSDLEPRYITGFNIPTDTENYFEVAYRSKGCIKLLEDQLTEWRTTSDRLWYSNNEDPVYDTIRAKLENLYVPPIEDILSIFDWHKQFVEEKDHINTKYIEYSSKIRAINDTSKNKIPSDVDREDIQRGFSYFYCMKELLDDLDLSHHPLFRTLKSNVLIIEGNAGCGKSHLLGYEAEKHGNCDRYRTILLLGQKLLFDGTPAEQIKRALQTQYDFLSYLDALEDRGERNDSVTVIMLDAINECAHIKPWKVYLNELLESFTNISI
jgi:hypothetical protein